MAVDVFISYSNKDKAVADAICARLESEGIRCWYAPRDIVPGADWAASIIDAIKAAKIMVLIFTDFSNASRQVLREVNNAVSNGLTIIPFKLTESLPTEGMQYYLGSVHWLDAMTEPLEQSIEALLKLTQALLSGEAPAPSERQFADAAPTGVAKKKAPVLPIALGAGALVVAAIGGFALLGQGAASGGPAASGAADADATSVVTEDFASYMGSETASIQDPTNSGSEGNLQCNYLNGGIAATDGSWIYYQSNDLQSVYRMRLDGSDKTKLNDQASSGIGVIDGKVYYRTSSGIYRMDSDGGNQTNLFLGTTEDMNIVDGRIYFKSSDDALRLYSMTLDGTDIRRENMLTDTYFLNIWEGRIYWANNGDARRLYSANLDGSDATVLTTSTAETIRVTDGWLLYYDMNAYEERIINLETNESYKAHPNGFYTTTISEHGIIGQMFPDSHLCRAQLGSSGANELVDGEANNICVVKDYVFYRGSDHQVHMVGIDGTNDVVV